MPCGCCAGRTFTPTWPTESGPLGTYRDSTHRVWVGAPRADTPGVTPDLSYAWMLLLGLGRVGLVFGVSFLLLTRLALPGTTRRSSWEGRGWGDAVLGVSATVVAATVLGVLGLFDTASLAATLGLALVGGATLRYRKLWRRSLLTRYADLLRWIERILPPDPIVEGYGPPRAPAERASAASRRVGLSPRAGWWVGVGVASALAAGVRLVPSFAQAAPFTLRYYAHLETLKGLRVGEPVGAAEGWGLHALALALSEMARVDPSLVLRGVGAVSAAAITYGVYQTARFYWAGRPGAFIGALFVAVGGPLLPLPLDRQAGAEPLMLAAALALPVFPHLASYIGSGGRRGLVVGGAGLMACGLVYPAVGALLAGTVAVYVLTIGGQVAWRRRSADSRARGRYRDRGLWRRMAVLGVGGLGLGALWVLDETLHAALSAPGSFAYFDVARALHVDPVPVAVAATLGGLVTLAPLVPGRARFEAVLPRPGALVRTGGQTLVMLALWLATGAGYDGLSGAAAVLLMAVVGVDLAMLVSEVRVRLAAAWPARARLRLPVWTSAAAALAVGGVVIGSGWSVPVPGPTVEPEGFVEAYLDIDKALLPYAWTAVGHRGTGTLVAHRGRFMDYAYFLERYDPTQYDHLGPGRIPTPDVLLFVENRPEASRVMAELMPSGRDLPERMGRWIAAYRERSDRADVSVFYRDDDLTVYRIARSAPTLLELDRGDGRLAKRRAGRHKARSPLASRSAR